MNTISVIGYVGREPEMKYTPDGNAVTEFSVADNRRYQNAAGQDVEVVNWFNVHAWGRLAEITNEWLEKGRQVYVQGRLDAHAYESRDGKSIHVSLDVTAHQIQFLGNSADGNGNGSQQDDNAPVRRNSNRGGNRGGNNRRSSRNAGKNPPTADGDETA